MRVSSTYQSLSLFSFLKILIQIFSQIKLLRFIKVDFDAIDQLLKVYSVFVQYWIKLGTQCSNTLAIYILEGH